MTAHATDSVMQMTHVGAPPFPSPSSSRSPLQGMSNFVIHPARAALIFTLVSFGIMK
jgi:hypothetical protein